MSNRTPPLTRLASCEEKNMKAFKRTYRIVTSIISVFFAVMLFVTIKDIHGVPRSLLFVAMGVAAIWGIYYFFLGSVFQHFYERGKKEGKQNNTDFA
jgi:uncharacterized membrane protein